jgi:class 3 adenylate cyclase
MGEATFVFADIAGFTALTEAHGDEEAVALIDAFTDLSVESCRQSRASTSRRSATP